MMLFPEAIKSMWQPDCTSNELPALCDIPELLTETGHVFESII